MLRVVAGKSSSRKVLKRTFKDEERVLIRLLQLTTRGGDGRCSENSWISILIHWRWCLPDLNPVIIPQTRNRLDRAFVKRRDRCIGKRLLCGTKRKLCYSGKVKKKHLVIFRKPVPSTREEITSKNKTVFHRKPIRFLIRLEAFKNIYLLRVPPTFRLTFAFTNLPHKCPEIEFIRD